MLGELLGVACLGCRPEERPTVNDLQRMMSSPQISNKALENMQRQYAAYQEAMRYSSGVNEEIYGTRKRVESKDVTSVARKQITGAVQSVKDAQKG